MGFGLTDGQKDDLVSAISDIVHAKALDSEYMDRLPQADHVVYETVDEFVDTYTQGTHWTPQERQYLKDELTLRYFTRYPVSEPTID